MSYQAPGQHRRTIRVPIRWKLVLAVGVPLLIVYGVMSWIMIDQLRTRTHARLETRVGQLATDYAARIDGRFRLAARTAKLAAETVKLYRRTCALPIMAQPNAGTPVLENMQVVYRQTPEEMTAELPELLETGISIVGGCCGSTAAHIRKFRELIDTRAEGESS